MPRDSWTAVMTLATMEYVVASELTRVGLMPYLAQRKARWTPRGAVKPMVRSIPIFPRYVFLPVDQARLPQLHYCRGLQGHKFLLSSADGSIWTASAETIHEIARLENEGAFDALEIVRGERVRLKTQGPLSSLDLLVATAGDAMVELLAPLFGGVKASARPADLIRVV
jgi:hypothetical protein